jgi:hypothetical protein
MVQAVTAPLRRLPLLLVGLVALQSAVIAHRLDEYLQASLLAIEPGGIRLQINLTPGVIVAEQLLARIDRDGDGAISRKEASAYGEELRGDLTARLDGHNIELKFTGFNFSEPAELRAGIGILQCEFSATAVSMTAGAHKLTLDNRHLPAISAYLVNAEKPKAASVRIITQKRNQNQSASEIDFSFDPAAKDSE